MLLNRQQEDWTVVVVGFSVLDVVSSLQTVRLLCCCDLTLARQDTQSANICKHKQNKKEIDPKHYQSQTTILLLNLNTL